MQGARQHREPTPEPDIVVELEKENVGIGLPSHSAMSNHLQPLSAPSSQGVHLPIYQALLSLQLPPQTRPAVTQRRSSSFCLKIL